MMTNLNIYLKLVCFACFRQTATMVVEDGVELKFKHGRGIYARGKTKLAVSNMKSYTVSQ